MKSSDIVWQQFDWGYDPVDDPVDEVWTAYEQRMRFEQQMRFEQRMSGPEEPVRMTMNSNVTIIAYKQNRFISKESSSLVP